MRTHTFEVGEHVIWSGNRGRIFLVTSHLGRDWKNDEPMYSIEELDCLGKRGLSATTAHESALRWAYG